MRQKDYILIAAALRKGAEQVKSTGYAHNRAREIRVTDQMIVAVCDALQAAHSGAYAFKRSTFLSAAGHSSPLEG